MHCRFRSLAACALAGLALTIGGCASNGTGPSPMSAAQAAGWNHFGFAGRDRGPVVALGALDGDEQNVIVEGTITDVCPKKGCWMTVRDGDDEVFVRFQDYAFFVPMNAAGHRVVMHGTALAQQTSVDELRHYAEDAGRSAAEIAAITEPEDRVTFFADAVCVEGADLDPPYGSSGR